MTITAVADASTTPPSVDVTVAVPAGYVMSSAAVWRNDSAGRSLVRSQPSAGFDERTVTDYECPFGETVTYDWVGSYTNPASYSTVFNETWASTAAWTIESGSWPVSGGKVTSTSGSIYRNVTPGKYRVTFSGVVQSSGIASGFTLRTYAYGGSGSGAFFLSFPAGGNLTVDGVLTTIDPTSPFTMDYLASSVVFAGTGGTYSLPYDRVLGSFYFATAGGLEIDDIKLESYGSEVDIAEESAPLSLEVDDVWLIHPGTPGLSIPVKETDPTTTRMVVIGDVENRTSATVHRILGSSTPVTTTTGPRANDVTSMTIETVETSEAAAVRALLASDIPILIQVPPAWGLNFRCGFYSVGDVTTSRSDPIINDYRTFTLPITKVRSPVVDVENSGWSYAAVAAEFTAYSELLDTYDTYADLAADSRV